MRGVPVVIEADDFEDVSPAMIAEAWEAMDEHRADESRALREAVGLLLDGGPVALLAAEGAIRSRLSDDGAYALRVLAEALFPGHDGIYWGRGDVG